MFGEMIPQTEEPRLKQTLKDLRNKCEMSQEELYQIARAKQYYVIRGIVCVVVHFTVGGVVTSDKMTKVLYIQFR